ncbi:zinc finger and BTB domain-containing protein 41 isoform 2-T3 [Cariama cristata]
MKKRRRLAANLNEKVHFGHEKDPSEQILVVDCAQEIVSKSAEIAPADQLESSRELSPSSEQRKLLSSLQYNKNLLKYLNDDRQKHPSFCDLLIIVEGKEFSAHKVVVAVGSSYFHACLSKNPSTDVVTLDHVTHSVFQHLLEFLYTSEFFVYKNEIPLVLEAAKFLDIIDAVKLLNNESVSNVQTDVVTDAPTPVETLSELTGKYESHTRVHTGEKPFECDICHQRYSTKSNLTVHRKKHSSDTDFHKKEHKCPYCNKLHASKKTLAKHVKRFHPENVQEFLSIKKTKSEGWKCDICKKSFTRRPHLEEHMILHSQDKPFKCTYCEEHFKSRFARLKHQEKFHLGPFPCDICGRQFNDTGNLKRHIECTHGGKRKWTCFICGKSVRERTTLKEHLRIHSGEKPHLCSICGQSFRHGSSYRLHLRVHHDDKRYECEECGKTFIRHDHLTKHKKIHSGEKAHQCEECGKCFGRRDHLTVHYKSVHLGEKVWQKYKATFHQCEVCKKVFKGKSSLEMHFRTHSGEKPYKCQICNQSFRIKKTLTKHMVIHSDARPFNCQHCNATFKRKDKLKYHIDHVHGSKAAEEALTSSSEEKLVSLPVQYTSDDKVYQTEAKQYVEQSKAYQSEAKTLLQNVSTEVCVPVTLVPVQMSDPQADLVQHTTQSHGILPPQPEQTDYQRATDLSFLEKYTLTPQPANIVHPVRPEQMLDPRDQSYLGTLLGLDTAPTVQNISNNEHS